MTATPTADAPSPQPVALPAVTVRINREVYDALAGARGYDSIASRAEWHRIDRSNLFDILAGRTVPRVDTAMGMARDCQTTVEALFGWVA